MPDVKRVALDWTGEGLRFRGGAPDTPEVTLDGDSGSGPSPMDALLLALAGCMGADVVHILRRGRVPLEGLRIEAEGERAETDPRRYRSIRLRYVVTGPAEEDQEKLERAVALSRETYCSVLHTLRPDVELEVEIGRG